MRLLVLCSLIPVVAVLADPVSTIDTSSIKFEDKQGYLKSVLKELDIDPSSQVLVFSKSSLQGQISPKNPRAIYFNEHTYVAFIPTAPMLEVMSVHPSKGPQFYTILNKAGGAKLEGHQEFLCFRCHGGGSSKVPSQLFATSSHVAPSGYPRLESRAVLVTAETPFENRWGGWYVTGLHGKMRHMGNTTSTPPDEAPKLNRDVGANITDLSQFFDTKKYLTPHSDLVALMVMEQQMAVQNALSAVAMSPTDAGIDRLVSLLLCENELKLDSPVKGTSGFTEYYSQRYPKDSKGRSLGQLDLNSRLLKYPCSPLVYSATFKEMSVRDRVIAKLREKASPEVREILSATLPGF
ncbi:MAG: hypothetical protein JNK63_00855 [Chthonomonas sp.]|nr:hypothetical protein [Chthonomonas sp.]